MACASSRRHRLLIYPHTSSDRSLQLGHCPQSPLVHVLEYSAFHLHLFHCSACRPQCKCYFLRRGCPELPDRPDPLMTEDIPQPTPPHLLHHHQPGPCPSGLLLTLFLPLLRAYSLFPHTAKVLPASGPLHMLFSQPGTISPQIRSQLFPFPAQESSLPRDLPVHWPPSHTLTTCLL